MKIFYPVLVVLVAIFALSSASCKSSNPADEPGGMSGDAQDLEVGVGVVMGTSLEFTASPGDPKTVSDPNYMVIITVTKFKGEEKKSKEFPLKRNDKIGKSNVKEKVKDPVTNNISYVHVDFSTTFTVTDIYFDDKGKEFVKITDNTGNSKVLEKKRKSK